MSLIKLVNEESISDIKLDLNYVQKLAAFSLLKMSKNHTIFHSNPLTFEKRSYVKKLISHIATSENKLTFMLK